MNDLYNYYDNLQVIKSFRDVSDHTKYHPLPDEWYVAVADIRQSTDAIRQGRYKEVNMAGASIIAAINNLYQTDRILPHLFSGDGSIIVLPDYRIEEIKGLLVFCKEAVKKSFGLEMSIGVYPVKEVREMGHDIAIAKFQLSNTIDQTVFWGDGIPYLENRIKNQDQLESVAPIKADFSGLECRWAELPSSKDEVVAYIIEARGKNDDENMDIYQDCFQQIENIYGKEESYHPISLNRLKMAFDPNSLQAELKLRAYPGSWLDRLLYYFRLLFKIAAGTYLMKFNRSTSKTNWGDYKHDLIKHADYKKFGNSLRFIAAGTIEQRMKMREFLETSFKNGIIAYGLHTSFASIITCFVKNYNQNHVHFVDGVDGGYAKASQELKNRLNKLGVNNN